MQRYLAKRPTNGLNLQLYCGYNRKVAAWTTWLRVFFFFFLVAAQSLSPWKQLDENFTLTNNNRWWTHLELFYADLNIVPDKLISLFPSEYYHSNDSFVSRSPRKLNTRFRRWNIGILYHITVVFCHFTGFESVSIIQRQWTLSTWRPLYIYKRDWIPTFFFYLLSAR